MFTRTLGTILRGSAAPMQLIVACFVGSLIGFVPGGFDHPELLLCWVLLLVVLNANIAVALVSVALAELLSLLLMPVSFATGRWLLEGPGESLASWASNAPILALLDLEYYVVSGGIVVGGVTGLLAGMLLAKTAMGFRRKFAALEEGSERYQNLTAKRSTRFLLWLVLGKKRSKQSYAELLSARFGSPVRKSGLVVAALLVLSFLFVPDLLSGPLLASAARAGLSSANGATVDLGGLSLDTKAGRVVFDGLAMADSESLGFDLLRATRIEADGSMEELLRGRLAFDRVVVIQGLNDVQRDSPGELFVTEEDEEPAAEEDDSGARVPGRNLDEYLADAEQWKQRLDQLRDWIDKLAPDATAEGGTGDESFEQRLAREVAAKGYAGVIATHLVREAPAFVVHELIAEGLSSSHLPDDPIDIRVTNISSAPELSDKPLRMTLRSQSGKLDVEIALGGRSAGADDNVVRFRLSGLPVERVAGSLARDGAAPLQGGTLDISLDGTWAKEGVGYLDLPLLVTLHDVTVELPGGPRTVDGVTLSFHISGPIDDPSIRFDDDSLQDTLIAGIRADLEGEFDRRKQELQDEADAKRAELEAASQAKLDDKLAGLLGEDSQQLDPDADTVEQLKKQLEAKAKKDLEEKAKGLLGGLFGGKQKDDGDD
jgi:uncharacterized protein (TIGR03546 family)